MINWIKRLLRLNHKPKWEEHPTDTSLKECEKCGWQEPKDD